MHNNKYKKISLFYTIADIYTYICSNIGLYSCHRILFLSVIFIQDLSNTHFSEIYENFFSYSSLLLGIKSFHSIRLAVTKI